MELKVLDSDFHTISNVDGYKSSIWTERYNSPGDFELTGHPVTLLDKQVSQGNYIYNPDSMVTMVIEDIKIETDVDDGAVMTVTGRSLESILDRRIVWNQTRLVGNVIDQIKYLIDNNCINPVKSERMITQLAWAAPSLNYTYTEEYDNQFIGESVLDAVEALCDTVELGFRLYLSETYMSNIFGTISQVATQPVVRCTGSAYLPVRPKEILTIDSGTTGVTFSFYTKNKTLISSSSISPTTKAVVPDKAYFFKAVWIGTGSPILRSTSPHLEFQVYDGLDRSWQQSTVPSIQFTPAFDNFKNSEYAEVSSEMANVALVGGDGEGSNKRFTEYIDGDTAPSDLERYETYVDDNTSQETDLLSVDEDETRNIPYKKLGDVYANSSSTAYATSSGANLWVSVPVEPNSEYTISIAEHQSKNIFDKLNPLEVVKNGVTIGTYLNAETVNGVSSIVVREPSWASGNQEKHRVILLAVEPNTTYTISTGTYSGYKVLASFPDRPISTAENVTPLSGSVSTNFVNGTATSLTLTTGPSDDWIAAHLFNNSDETGGRNWTKSINSLVVVKGTSSDIPSTYVSYGPQKLSCHWSAAFSEGYPTSGASISSNKSMGNLYPYENDEEDDPTRHSDDWLYDPEDTEERPSSVEIKSGSTEKYLNLGVCNLSEKSAGSIDLDNLIDLFEITGKMRYDNYIAILEAKGKETLEEKKLNVTFEGEIEPSINYTYGIDYFMGDIVTIQNEYGFEGRQRMTEFIRSYDSNGYTEVPSFTTKKDTEEN